MSVKICVIGTGYVGLVSGVCFSDLGYKVTCIDQDEVKIKSLKAGKVPIYEPGLEEMLHRNVNEGRLVFSTPSSEVVKESDFVLIAVGTPTLEDSGAADLTYVFEASKEIAQSLDGYTTIITKSTVPVGTGDEIEKIFKAHNNESDFDIVSNPEFLREGAAIQDFLKPDRIVIGCNSESACVAMKELYRPFMLKNTPILFCKRRTSELIKYASNAFLATKISFINEIADLCEYLGADIAKVAHGMGQDNRIGSRFLRAGPGYGGSCFPKDTLALANTARENGYTLKVVEAVIDVNKQRKKRMSQRVLDNVTRPYSNKTIGILGLAFKPDTDDIRESPALTIVQEIVKTGAAVKVFDPEAMSEFRQVFPDITYCDDTYSCAEGADVLVIITEWGEFRTLDFHKLSQIMKSKTLVDLRNIYSPETIRNHGFKYSSVGRL